MQQWRLQTHLAEKHSVFISSSVRGAHLVVLTWRICLCNNRRQRHQQQNFIVNTNRLSLSRPSVVDCLFLQAEGVRRVFKKSHCHVFCVRFCWVNVDVLLMLWGHKHLHTATLGVIGLSSILCVWLCMRVHVKGSTMSILVQGTGHGKMRTITFLEALHLIFSHILPFSCFYLNNCVI